MPRSHLEPENESLQNEADKSIFTSKFIFVLVTKSTQQKPKIFKHMLRSKRACPTAISPTNLVLMQLGMHYV